MLLTITTTHEPATDLGYLLHKHPARVQSFDVSFGKVHVFYPEARAERCTAALLLDVDAIGYVNFDRVGLAGDGGPGIDEQLAVDPQARPVVGYQREAVGPGGEPHFPSPARREIVGWYGWIG